MTNRAELWEKQRGVNRWKRLAGSEYARCYMLYFTTCRGGEKIGERVVGEKVAVWGIRGLGNAPFLSSPAIRPEIDP